MSVDRSSVTVPSELGTALRALARARGETVSTIVTEAITNQVRLAALDDALAEATRRFGPVPERLVARAESFALERGDVGLRARLTAARRIGMRLATTCRGSEVRATGLDRVLRVNSRGRVFTAKRS